MEQLKTIKQCLVSAVQTQLGDLKKTDAKELGEVIDMIKDLEEAMYYCSITEAMEKSAEEKEQGNMNVNYYMEPMYYRGQPRDGMGRYMSGGSQDNSDMGQTRNYVPYMEYAPYMMRDDRWRDEHLGDKSGMSRRMYMESKQMHGDGQQSMKELEHYIKDLGEDLTDMIKESSQEEKQVLSSKLSQLRYQNKMITAVINGVLWEVQIVPPTFPTLFTGDSFTLGCCDNNTHIIYIADGLSERKFYKVLGHEMTHAAMFSYGVQLTYDQEELLADIISTYGKEIVMVTNKVFKKIKGMY